MKTNQFKNYFNPIIQLSIVFLILFFNPLPLLPCTSLAVGINATKDNIVIFGRDEDCFKNNWNKYLVVREQVKYKEGEIITLGNSLKVPAPEIGFRYTAMPDAIANEEEIYATKGRYFEERGINSKNVAISATTSVDINDKAQKADPFMNPGIDESIITTLILPRATSAIHGVQLLGEFVEKYGAAEGNGVQIGDINGIWYFEIGSAHHWIAVKVPDDSYLIAANGLRIHSVNLDDINVLHSKGLFEFVV
jgi:dipeptidase